MMTEMLCPSASPSYSPARQWSSCLLSHTTLRSRNYSTTGKPVFLCLTYNKPLSERASPLCMEACSHSERVTNELAGSILSLFW